MGVYPQQTCAVNSAASDRSCCCHGTGPGGQNPPTHLRVLLLAHWRPPGSGTHRMPAAVPKGCRQRLFLFLSFSLKQTPINVNTTDVNKHNPKIHVQLYIMGVRMEEKRFN